MENAVTSSNQHRVNAKPSYSDGSTPMSVAFHPSGVIAVEVYQITSIHGTAGYLEVSSGSQATNRVTLILSDVADLLAVCAAIGKAGEELAAALGLQPFGLEAALASATKAAESMEDTVRALEAAGNREVLGVLTGVEAISP